MTFQPKLDLWEAERLRTSNVAPVNPAAELIAHIVAAGGAELTWWGSNMPSPDTSVHQWWSFSWRHMIARNLRWAALALTTHLRVRERQAAPHLAGADPARVCATAKMPLCETEVDVHAAA
jgi:hypothetical protein